MKANKLTVSIINFVIFGSILTLGILSGNYAGDYRIGTHLGMGLGMMGIITYGYLRERTAASLKDARIPRKAISDVRFTKSEQQIANTERQKAA